MSDSLRQRPGSNRNGVVGSHAREIAVEAHRGSPWDFLRRHENECKKVAQASLKNPKSRKAREDLAAKLLTRAADPRNIKCAIDTIAAKGKRAAGRDGKRLEHLSRFSIWELIRRLSQAMLELIFVAGEPRRRNVKKTSGTGTRPIEIANLDVKVASRSLLQILQPFLDPLLDPFSLGGRPGISREKALLTFLKLQRQLGSRKVIAEDFKDAFTTLPQGRLWDVLRRKLCCGHTPEQREQTEQLIQLIHNTIGRERTQGVPQGNELSMLLINVYLDETVTKPWKRRHPNVPIIRVVDDLLIVLRPEDDADQLYASLKQVATSAGMRLKGTPETTIRLLDHQAAVWLGLSITLLDDAPQVNIGPKAFDSLTRSLEECHWEPDPPAAAHYVLQGWIQALGACYHHRRIRDVYSRVQHLASELSFEESPSEEEFAGLWQQAHARYRLLRRSLFRSDAGAGPCGFAYQDDFAVDNDRGAQGHGFVALPPFLTREKFRIWTDGSCLTNPGPGGWAYLIEDHRGRPVAHHSGSALHAKNNQMELRAVIAALERLRCPSIATVYTDSKYVCWGLNRLLEWEGSNWRAAAAGKLRNAHLWRRLAALCHHHEVRRHWVRGHATDHNNNRVDRMAKAAAAVHCCSTSGERDG